MRKSTDEINQILENRYVLENGEYYRCRECDVVVHIGENKTDFFRHEWRYHSDG